MDIQKNLAVLRQYYAANAYPGKNAVGDIYGYMAQVVSQEKVKEDSIDAKALIACCMYLQENGFSDLYFNGRRRIATKYGAVPMELEICFAVDHFGVVSSFRIELFLRYTMQLALHPDGARLCGRWHWDRDCGLITDVPIDMSRVIWGLAK